VFLCCYPALQCWSQTEVVAKGEMNFDRVLCTAFSLALMLLLKALILERRNNFSINNVVINSYSTSKARVCTVK